MRLRFWFVLGVSVIAAVVAATAFAGVGRVLVVQADCSQATATQLVNQNDLNNFLLQDPVQQVLCGSFTGPDSEAMVVAIGAPTCWGTQRWAVFRFSGGAWELVLSSGVRVSPLGRCWW